LDSHQFHGLTHGLQGLESIGILCGQDGRFSRLPLLEVGLIPSKKSNFNDDVTSEQHGFALTSPHNGTATDWFKMSHLEKGMDSTTSNNRSVKMMEYGHL